MSPSPADELLDAVKTMARRHLSVRQWHALSRARRIPGEAQRALGALTSQVLSRAPLPVLAVLRERLRSVGRLDYRPAPVRMNVGSAIDLARLHSCAKEPETVAWLESELRPGDVFYDIGANVGAYSLVANAVTAGRTTVFSFEPGAATFAELCDNICLNEAQGSIFPMPVALSDGTGLGKFTYADRAAGAAAHNLTGARIDLTRPAPGVNSMEQFVLCYCLDELIDTFKLPAPNLVKIDVDGHELATLEGAPRTLADRRLRSLLVEAADQEVEERLAALLSGYGMMVTGRHSHRPGLVTNIVFRRVDDRRQEG